MDQLLDSPLENVRRTLENANRQDRQWRQRNAAPTIFGEGVTARADLIDLETAIRQQIHKDLNFGGTKKGALRRLAELDAREQKKSALRKKLAETAHESASLDAACQSETAPVRAKLDTLGSEILDALTTNGPSEILERQRESLSEQLLQIETAAKQKRALLDSRRELLEGELNSVSLNTDARDSLLGRIRELAPAEDRARVLALRNTVEGTSINQQLLPGAGERAKQAAQALAKSQHYLAELKEAAEKNAKLDPHSWATELSVQEWHVAQWQAELDEANRVCEEAGRMRRELEAQILNG